MNKCGSNTIVWLLFTPFNRFVKSMTAVACTLGAFATRKSHILYNVELRPLALRRIEASRFGIQAIRSHAPSLGLALEGRFHFLEDGSFGCAAPCMHLEEFNPAPGRKMFDRLKSFSRPTLSIMARCTGYNTFILSVMPFSLSYFGLTSKDLHWLRQAASQYILKRKWIEAEILPYILSYVGITTLLDPALSAAVSALGLYYEKAILLKIFIMLAMRVDAPIVGNVLLFRISLICGAHMSFLRTFLGHSRRGLTHLLKSSNRW